MTSASTERNSNAVIGEMADLLARHKLVPFFGAGVSRQHLGFAADELAGEMASATGQPPETLLADVADVFADARGEQEFVAFLRERLVVKELNERKAPSHRLLVSLMQNLLYTTNQDNLFELTAARYGRNYRPVISVEDLSEAAPGEPLLIKFHGDTSQPESLVFGTRSYQRRLQAEDHPLDIKLRADLLGKRLLFLGYSLRDENVAKIFKVVRRASGGTLPTSYLVAFDDDPQLIAAAREYQVTVVVPSRLFPEHAGSAEAFERFMQALCDETRRRQVAIGTANLFSDGPLNPKIVTDYEVKAVERVVENDPFKTALETYRATFDLAHAPEHLQQEVEDLFVALVAKADPTQADEMAGLAAALFNFDLPPMRALAATAHVMAACNRRPVEHGFDSLFALVCPALPERVMPVAAACAVAILRERDETITENFRRLASWWFRGHESLDAPVKESVALMMKAAWPGRLEAQSPLQRPTPSLGAKTFHEILADLESKLPTRIRSLRE